MQAIITQVLPPNKIHPLRIRAKCSRGHTTIIADTTHEQDHHNAALALLQIFRNQDDHNRYLKSTPQTSVWAWDIITGCLPNGDYVHVLVNPREYHPVN